MGSVLVLLGICRTIEDWRNLRHTKPIRGHLCVAANVAQGDRRRRLRDELKSRRNQIPCTRLAVQEFMTPRMQNGLHCSQVRCVNCKFMLKSDQFSSHREGKASRRLTFGMRSDRKILFEWHWLAQSFLCLCVLHFMHFSSSSSLYVLKRELLITVLGIRFYFTHNKFTWNIFKLLRVVESDKFMRHETFCAALWKKTLWG